MLFLDLFFGHWADSGSAKAGARGRGSVRNYIPTHEQSSAESISLVSLTCCMLPEGLPSEMHY